MKFFIFISLSSALLLFFQGSSPKQKPQATIDLPSKITERKEAFVTSFKSSQEAHALWSLMFGDKKDLSFKIKKDFQTLSLGYLLSPTSLHLYSLFFIFGYLLRKFVGKKMSSQILFFCSCLCFFLPYLAIKRIIIFKILNRINKKLKKTYSSELLFLITFVIAFLSGHYSASPLGFTCSFLYFGTYIALARHSKLQLLLGILSNHFLIAFFQFQSVSPLAMLLNLPFLGVIPFYLLVSYFYFLTFKWFDFNWIQPINHWLIISIKFIARLTVSSQMSSSLFIILGLWAIMHKKPKGLILICFFIHSGLAMAPTYSLG